MRSARVPYPQRPTDGAGLDPLARARRKAYLRLMPLLFVCFVINYIDRANLAIAKLTMVPDLGFDNAIFGRAAGVFFLGYVLLEVPGALLVERWSARKWIARIMITWGIVAGLQAAVRTPTHFYVARFFLGLAEAGFFPGCVVYLTHWFPRRDRARALALFLVATPVAQLVNPKLSNLLLEVGTSQVVAGVTVHHPRIFGMVGWQLVYVAWALPAVILGVVVLLVLPDHPRHARWLAPDERAALEAELERDRLDRGTRVHMTLGQAFCHPKVVLISLAYAFAITAYYGVEFFVPSILARWYTLDLGQVTWLVMLPAATSFVGQLFAGFSSDRTGERRLHAVVPLVLAALALALTPASQGSLAMTVTLLALATLGLKAYLPAFWCLPTLLLTESAAAGSAGFINAIGNFGGFVGPMVIGLSEKATGSFAGGIYFIAATAGIAAAGLYAVGLGAGRRAGARPDVVDGADAGA